MAQGMNSTKSAARPSHEAIEEETTANEGNKSGQERMDHAAMESAKRLRIESSRMKRRRRVILRLRSKKK